MRVKSIYKKCLERESSLIITLYKYLIYKFIYKKEIFCHHGVSVKGVKNINSTALLEIGMGKVGFSNKYDKTLLNLQGKLILEGVYSIGREDVEWTLVKMQR